MLRHSVMKWRIEWETEQEMDWETLQDWEKAIQETDWETQREQLAFRILPASILLEDDSPRFQS